MTIFSKPKVVCSYRKGSETGKVNGGADVSTNSKASISSSFWTSVHSNGGLPSQALLNDFTVIVFISPAFFGVKYEPQISNTKGY